MRPYGCGASVRVGAIVHEGCEADEPQEMRRRCRTTGDRDGGVLRQEAAEGSLNRSQHTSKKIKAELMMRKP
jgi:hypothetical protein